MDNQYNLLTQLPKDILENNLSSLLNLQDLYRISCVSKPVNSLFQKPFTERKFFEALRPADYDFIEAMIANDVELMFEKNNGESALSYAFKMCDTFLWQIFLNAVLAKKDQDLLKRFYQVLDKTTETIDVQPLFDAYQHLGNQHDLFNANQISKQQLDADWLELGKVQAKYLSCHLMQLLLSSNTDWNKGGGWFISWPCYVSSFDNRPKLQNKVQVFVSDKISRIFDLNRLGEDFTLVRSMMGRGVGIEPGDIPSYGMAHYDMCILIKKWEARNFELALLKSDLLRIMQENQQISRPNCQKN